MSAALRKIVEKHPSKVTGSELMQLASFPAIRKQFSSALAKKPLKIAIDTKGARNYVHFRLLDPKKWQVVGRKKLGNDGTEGQFACPKGKMTKVSGNCKVGTRLQAVLVPKNRILKVAKKYLGKSASPTTKSKSTKKAAPKRKLAKANPSTKVDAAKIVKNMVVVSTPKWERIVKAHNLKGLIEVEEKMNGNRFFLFVYRDAKGKPLAASLTWSRPNGSKHTDRYVARKLAGPKKGMRRLGKYKENPTLISVTNPGEWVMFESLKVGDKFHFKTKKGTFKKVGGNTYRQLRGRQVFTLVNLRNMVMKHDGSHHKPSTDTRKAKDIKDRRTKEHRTSQPRKRTKKNQVCCFRDVKVGQKFQANDASGKTHTLTKVSARRAVNSKGVKVGATADTKCTVCFPPPRKATKRNPGPGRRKKPKKIPFKQFVEYAQSNFNRKQMKEFKAEIQAYKRFHQQNKNPKHVLAFEDALPGQIKFATAMGRSPTETYITPNGSGKGSEQPFLHEYEDMPVGLAMDGGNIVVKVLEGGAYIDDWIHG